MVLASLIGNVSLELLSLSLVWTASAVDTEALEPVVHFFEFGIKGKYLGKDSEITASILAIEVSSSLHAYSND
jgi:hypothetical protein